ncbi:pumilio homolog 12-like [Henckelia pumila]|uniref:pumilio homolog 12-like n=1 Tax=Henckelia pumila TaxID=405737 RepID=UPI003C6DFC29
MEDLTNFSAETIPLDLSHPGVHRFAIVVDKPSPPVSAGDGPTNRQPSVSSLEDLRGKVFSESMDPCGCQFLHQKLQGSKSEDIQMIFSEVKDRICDLMIHRWGSYAIQKLFHVCDEEQMNQLVSLITANVSLLMSVCLHPQGSESMKKFIECLMTPKQISYMVAVFSYFTVPLVKNQFGSLVVGHFFRIFPAEDTKPILKVIADDCSEIIVDDSGSRLLQDIMTKDYSPRGSVKRIITVMFLNIFGLSLKQFGNRLVQHVIGFERPHLTEHIVSELTGTFDILSRDLYGSEVVKKLMEASDKKYAPQIIDELLSSDELPGLVVDPCGNSVLQNAKKYSTGTVHKTLNDLIGRYSQLITPPN